MSLEHWIPSRNDIVGFADRTRRNLDFIIASHEKGAPVHVVTQVVLSLLGIIVFPFERRIRFDRYSLEALEAKGWPRWQVDQGSKETRTLQHLLNRIRNATAHNDIKFDSDSDTLSDVTLSLTQREQDGTWVWTGHIHGDDLLDFCRRFLELIKNELE